MKKLVAQKTEVQTKNVAIVSASVSVLLMFLIIAVYLRYFSAQLQSLPDEISWSFLLQRKYPWRYVALFVIVTRHNDWGGESASSIWSFVPYTVDGRFKDQVRLGRILPSSSLVQQNGDE